MIEKSRLLKNLDLCLTQRIPLKIGYPFLIKALETDLP